MQVEQPRNRSGLVGMETNIGQQEAPATIGYYGNGYDHLALHDSVSQIGAPLKGSSTSSNASPFSIMSNSSYLNVQDATNPYFYGHSALAPNNFSLPTSEFMPCNYGFSVQQEKHGAGLRGSFAVSHDDSLPSQPSFACNKESAKVSELNFCKPPAEEKASKCTKKVSVLMIFFLY